MVLSGKARTGIHYKQHHIGFGHSLTRLLGHLRVDAGLSVGFESTSVNHDEFVATLPPVSVMAIAGETCIVGHDGVT
jgi:hypothetical protein